MMRRMRRGRFRFDFVGGLGKFLLISGILIAISAASLIVKQFNLGLEFRGGVSFEVSAQNDATVEDMRDVLDELNLDGVVQAVRTSGEAGRGFLIQTRHVSEDLQGRLTEAVATTAGSDPDDINVTAVGPKWGAQVTEKAVRALVIFLLIVAVYISLRFEPKMAAAAMLALVHDLLITAGVYSLIGFPVTPATVIAVLTVLGYSLYDTIVIFDRVKDHAVTLSAAGRQTYSQMANESLNEVLVRSINTSIIGLIPVGSLLFIGSFLLGAETLQELALALFIGIAVGTYSSIFIATPVLAAWKEREPRWATLRARIAARSADTTAPRISAGADDEGAVAPVGAAGTAPSGRPYAGRPPRPPKKRKRRR